ncbi:hypothetical protein EG328_001011 [Venturia inaequalis]|nr:hypothetical protein EG328_001011 [Venturia inaequalis]
MVGKRVWTSGPDGDKKKNGNLKPAISRFQDASNKAVEDDQREQIKNKLIDGVEREALEHYRKSKDEIKTLKSKKVRNFYESQNNSLNDWLEVDAAVRSIADDIFDSFDPDRDHDGINERSGGLQLEDEDVEAFLPKEEREKREGDAKHARIAININVVANIFLLAAKIGAVFYSSSLSLIASLADSALDLLCTLIVWSTNRIVSWRLAALQKRFPVGRKRLEPMGILVFSVLMVVSFAQILQESVTKLLPSGDHSSSMLPPIAIAALVGTVVVKGIIGLGCLRIKTTQVQALVQDCQTDVIFNTLSLLFPVIGHKVGAWWLDPVGAGLLSLFIIYDWAGTAFENVARLSGLAVDDRTQKKLMFLIWRFHPVVEGFKSLKAYHAGDGVWVEVDILLHPHTKLMKAHDISETLQYCLEGLPEVDRAFVTVDYTSSGPSGHAAMQGS